MVRGVFRVTVPTVPMVVSLTGIQIEKFNKALSFRKCDDWNVFSNDVLDAYILLNSVDAKTPDVSADEEVFEVGKTYFHNWSNGKKTVKIEVKEEGVEILEGSDFEMTEVDSLSYGHVERRKKLLSDKYVVDGKFIKNYSCSTPSTAASVTRGIQLSGKQAFKKNEKLDWTSIVAEAIIDLGGTASLKEIYKKVKSLHPDRLTHNYRDTIRATIYRSSSDSEYFQDGVDMFKRVGEGRTGVWAIR